MRDAENVKLKAIIKELKSENVELRDHVTKVEERQCLRPIREKKFLRESANDQDSKLSRDKKTVTNGNDQDLKLSLNTGDNISAPSSIEDNLVYDSKQMITCTDSEDAPSDEMSGLIATQPLDRNQVTEQTLKHELSKPIFSVTSVELHDESILNNAIEDSTQRLAYWIADGKTKDKTAKSMIYKEMLQYLPNVTLGNLRIRTHRAKNIFMLFGEKGVGINRIKLVTCSASDISRLNNTQIQNIIDYVN
ncbi:unnamed protein product [Rhizophagus irregularis]|nr:unnamed protein product [Rhizophagus irregularis]